MSERVCIITGAGQGIGRALALYFAARGVHVAIAEQNAANAAKVAAEIAAAGGQARAIATDVTAPDQVRAMVAQVQETFGRVNILINNARWTGLAPARVQDIGDADWRRALDVNVTGAFHCARAVVPIIMAAGFGRIINMSSVEGKHGKPFIVQYVTAKHALNGFTKGLSKEVATEGITVNALCPGLVITDLIHKSASVAAASAGISTEEFLDQYAAEAAIKRPITADEVAALAVLVASPAGSGITGALLSVDGGTAAY